MFHQVTFVQDYIADECLGKKDRLQKVKIEKGEQFHVKLRPYVKGLDWPENVDPIEVADLDHGEGIFLAVPYAAFTFHTDPLDSTAN